MCFNHAGYPIYSMTDHFTDISVAARLSELTKLLGAIAGKAEQLGISGDISLRLQLIVEELFTNTINHGYRGNGDTPVRVSLAIDNNGVALRYVDSAPAFNPFEIGPNFASTAEVGGQGLNLIRGLCRTCHYERQNGRNLVELVV